MTPAVLTISCIYWCCQLNTQNVHTSSAQFTQMHTHTPQNKYKDDLQSVSCTNTHTTHTLSHTHTHTHSQTHINGDSSFSVSEPEKQAGTPAKQIVSFVYLFIYLFICSLVNPPTLPLPPLTHTHKQR